MLENTVPWRIFGPKRVEVAGDYIDELNDLYSLPNIIRVIKSKRVRWTGHI